MHRSSNGPATLALLARGRLGARGSCLGWITLVALLWQLQGAGSVRGQIGPDMQVNSYTTSYQSRPSIAMAPSGVFVVVWSSFGSPLDDDLQGSVQGQRYDAAGNAVGSQFQVNASTQGSQRSPSVAMDDAGNFVVVWNSSFSVGDPFGSIQAQLFDDAGTRIGTELQVNSYTTDNQSDASVAMDADGDFVVVWRSYGSGGTDTSGTSVQGQRFDSLGNPNGTEFQVNSYTTDDQRYPSVAAGSDGSFVVVWYSAGSFGDDPYDSVQGLRYDTDGTPLASQFQVNTYTTSYQGVPSVARGTSGFVVVWASAGSYESDSDPLSLSIQGQRYDALGAPLGFQFQVNSYTTGYQTLGSVAANADGDFVVVWQSTGSAGGDDSDYSIQGQRYNAKGTPVAAEFQVNSYTSSYQHYPAVAMRSDGDAVVVWESDGSSGGDTSATSIQRTRTLRLFADGFESGDTAAWSMTSGLP